jgi:hypothetical protein
MAFDGALQTRETFLPQIRIEVVPNRFARAPVLDGDVKVHDRLALMFGYASVGVGIGVASAMIATAVHPALVPVIAAASLIGSILLACKALRKLHWGAVTLVVLMHLSAMAATAGVFLPEVSAQLLPLAGLFIATLVVLALGYGRWFTTVMNVALQALLLAAPFGAAMVASFFNRVAF